MSLSVFSNFDPPRRLLSTCFGREIQHDCFLQAEKMEKEKSNGPATNPFSPQASIDLLGSGSPVTSPSQPAASGGGDLFSLDSGAAAPAAAANNPFASSMAPQAAPVDLFGGAAPASTWGTQGQCRLLFMCIILFIFLTLLFPTQGVYMYNHRRYCIV